MTHSERDSVRTEPVPDPDPGLCSTCRSCGGSQHDDARFCESCGCDRTTIAWSIEIGVDRSRADAALRNGLEFPHDRPPVVIEIDADQVVIGRRSASRDAEPDVDLSGALADPGVSHLHAVVRLDTGGTMTVTDLGSTNGTTVNGNTIESHEPQLLVAGDHIAVGVWTVIRPSPRPAMA